MPEFHSNKMMSIENNVDDLNLDFSDRNCEAQQNNGGKFMYDFLLHDSGSEADSESDISTHEEVDLDDEYFFDNKIDFSHYLPKVPPKKESLDPVDIKRQEVVAKVQDVFSNVVKPVSRTNSVEIPNGNLNVNKTNIDVVVDAVGDVTEGVQDCDIDARRNDREEIRKKLAMGAEDDGLDDDDDDEEVTYNKPNIQSRLHSGLQICFMNESPGDTDNEGMSPRQQEFHDNAKLLKKVSSLVDSDNNLSTVTDLNNPSPPTTSVQCSSPPRLKADSDEKAEDFHSRQEQLQNEAKLALAQAGSMAHMQLEIEKQTKKKSPMAEMVGIPGLGERHRKKLSVRQLQQMNLASIQVLYNDLQTQIENLNEELVHLLMERDELHMEQDSMLVDIEDLTRRAEELAERANRTGGNKGNKTSKVKGKLPAR